MKLKFSVPVILAVAGICYLGSCKKNADIPEPYCVAGNEGSITLRLFPEHHGESIGGQTSYPDSAFIKFNSNEYPGGEDPAFYDLVVAGNPGDSVVVVNNLSCGTYFIFMTGYDVSIAQRVKGGIPVTVHYDDTSEDMIIPVTED